MWIFLRACAIAPVEPATPGSTSSDAAAEAAQIAEQIAEVGALAHELTSLIDESRRQVEAGTSTKEDEIAKMRELMARIGEKNTALQADIARFEESVHERAGDPAWPPEPIPKR